MVFHLTTATPITAIPYLLSSLASWVKKSPHIPTANPCFGLQLEQIDQSLGAQLGLTQWLHSCPQGTACPILIHICHTGFGFRSIHLFFFYWGRVASPMPNPQPGGPGSTLCLDSTLQPV